MIELLNNKKMTKISKSMKINSKNVISNRSDKRGSTI